MRGVLVGTYVVAVNILGLALGPSLIAFATDYLFADRLAVGKSLATVGVVVGVIGALLIYRALGPLAEFTRRHLLESGGPH